MITDVDYLAENFTYTIGGVNTVVDFSTITGSSSWTDYGNVSFDSATIPVYRVNLYKSAFLAEVSKRTSAERSEDAYLQAKIVYKLIRVLEGASEANAEAEMSNLEDQYDALDADKQTVFSANDTAVSDWLDAKGENEAREAKAVEIAQLEADMARKQDIRASLINNELPFDVWLYDRGNDILTWESVYYNLLKARIQYADALNNLEDVFTTYKGDAAIDILQEDYQELIDARDAIVVDINSLDTEDPGYAASKGALEKQLTLNQQYLSQKKADLFSALTTLIETNQAINVTAVNELHVTISDALTAQLVTDTATLADLQDEYDAMPHDDELPGAPEKTELTTPVSVTMRKMIYVANDDSWPDVDLSNVTPDDVSEYETANGPIIL